MKTQQLIFINYYDVLGNEFDGYDVNDVSQHRINGLIPDTSQDVLNLLIDNDIVHRNVTLADVEIEIDEFGAEITESKTGRPFGRIEWDN